MGENHYAEIVAWEHYWGTPEFWDFSPRPFPGWCRQTEDGLQEVIIEGSAERGEYAVYVNIRDGKERELVTEDAKTALAAAHGLLEAIEGELL